MLERFAILLNFLVLPLPVSPPPIGQDSQFLVGEWTTSRYDEIFSTTINFNMSIAESAPNCDGMHDSKITSYRSPPTGAKTSSYTLKPLLSCGDRLFYWININKEINKTLLESQEFGPLARIHKLDKDHFELRIPLLDQLSDDEMDELVEIYQHSQSTDKLHRIGQFLAKHERTLFPTPFKAGRDLPTTNTIPPTTDRGNATNSTDSSTRLTVG